MNIDFRDWDQREHGMTPSMRMSEPAVVDLALAQKIREAMRRQGLRVPLTDAEQFEAADRRMRESGKGGA